MYNVSDHTPDKEIKTCTWVEINIMKMVTCFAASPCFPARLQMFHHPHHPENNFTIGKGPQQNTPWLFSKKLKQFNNSQKKVTQLFSIFYSFQFFCNFLEVSQRKKDNLFISRFFLLLLRFRGSQNGVRGTGWWLIHLGGRCNKVFFQIGIKNWAADIIKYCSKWSPLATQTW